MRLQCESNAKCALDSKATRSLQKRLDAKREMRRIRSPDPLSGNAKAEVEMLFNNLNKKSVWTLTGVELIEITLPFGK